jgi:hypothetical protein
MLKRRTTSLLRRRGPLPQQDKEPKFGARSNQSTSYCTVRTYGTIYVKHPCRLRVYLLFVVDKIESLTHLQVGDVFTVAVIRALENTRLMNNLLKTAAS